MNPELLLNHFDRISDAPDAISRLRQFVLELAVRGALAKQDPNDEPASQLLKRIQEYKRRRTGTKIGKERATVPISAQNAMLFPIPESWVWVSIGEVFDYDAGTKREPKQLDPERWLLELEDIEKDTSVALSHLRVKDRDSLSTKSEFMVGDILYGKLRPYLNKVVVADEPGYSTTEIVAIRPFLPLCSEYCAMALRRPDFVKYVERLGRGTKMPRLRTPDAIAAPFPLPPLAEQHRIVAKVHELMALCDRLETARAERESRRDRLTTASHYHLTNGADVEAFRKHVHFCLNHLPHFTNRPEQIKQFRQTILNLAVRGRLVAQTPNDESASLLLKRLAAEIKTYACEQKISPSRPEPIREEEIPYPVPTGWIWTRLCSIFRVVTDGDHQPPPKEPDGVAFLTIGNVTTGSLDFSNCRFVSPSYLESVAEYRKPSYGDILYTVVGATYGRPVLVDSKRPFCVQRHIAILKPPRDIDIKFLRLLLASALVYSQATKSATGAAQPTVALKPLRNFLVPLPPLAEQHRIVGKVDELMTICDRLETQLTTARAESCRLLESVLHNALGDTSLRDFPSGNAERNMIEVPEKQLTAVLRK
jgi:type I restriction enzyme S subunit